TRHRGRGLRGDVQADGHGSRWRLGHAAKWQGPKRQGEGQRVKPTTAILDAIDRARREGRVVERAAATNGGTDNGCKPDVREREFMQAVLQLARRQGWLCYHTHDSRRSEAGFPDLCLVRAGRLLLVELKTEDGELSAPQRTWAELLSAIAPPVEYAVWRP